MVTAANTSASISWLVVALPAAIGAAAGLFATAITLYFQGKRDARGWARQERTRAYEDALTTLNDLLAQTLQAADRANSAGAAPSEAWTRQRDRLLAAANALDHASTRVQMYGSPALCKEMVEVMVGTAMLTVRRISAKSAPDRPAIVQLAAAGAYAQMNLTNAVRRDLGVEGDSAYEAMGNPGRSSAPVPS